MSDNLSKSREELVALVREDERVRDRLAADGSLFEGYDTIMEAVHQHNAARLRMVIDEHGWPGEKLFGKDGAEAAWRIAQHAIGEPNFQRRCLDLLYDAVERGEAPARQAAFLEDRVRMFEGRGQLYATQFDVGPDGLPMPYPIENPEGVDARRGVDGTGAARRPTCEGASCPAHRPRGSRSSGASVPAMAPRRRLAALTSASLVRQGQRVLAKAVGSDSRCSSASRLARSRPMVATASVRPAA